MYTCCRDRKLFRPYSARIGFYNLCVPYRVGSEVNLDSVRSEVAELTAFGAGSSFSCSSSPGRSPGPLAYGLAVRV